MKKRNTKQVILPLITSFIWGSSFVAQSLGAGKVGGFTFTASRSIPAVLVLGALVLILRRVRHAKVQIEDTIFWLMFSAALLILALFPGIAYWAANLLGFMSPINFVYVVIIFLLLAKQFFMSIKLSQLDSKVRILTEQVALNEEKVEREKLDL